MNILTYLPVGLTATSYVTDGMKTALQTGFQQVATDVSSVVSSTLPIGLGIMGLFLGIRLAIGFFRSVAH